ncbi:MAG TPA: type II CAAX endopeptidase family protein [Candidatus Acidoferrum sp.]|nr:type II CAAX endopeptidase family protein [Candidatus Acidoferrum sp.]
MSGTIWAALAFIVPQYIVVALVPLVTKLHVSDDAKLFVLQALVELLTLGIILAVIYLYKARFSSIGLTEDIPAATVGLAVAALPIYIVISYVVAHVLAALVPGIDLNARQNIGYRAGGLAEMVLIFIALVIIPPVVEEILFRGFLYTAYRKRFGFVTASVFISFLFAAAHAPIAVSIDVFILSLFLCYLREKTSRLWPSILLHSLKNLVAFVVLFIMK